MLNLRSLPLYLLAAGACRAPEAQPPIEAASPTLDSVPEGEALLTPADRVEPPRPDLVGPISESEALKLDQDWVAANLYEVGPGTHAIELPLSTVLESVEAWAHESLEEAYVDAIDTETGLVQLRATSLDAAGKLLLVELSWGAFDRAYLLVDAKGTRIGPAVQGVRMLAFTSDVAGDATKELVVRQIHEMAMSSFPVSWTIYTASSAGLRKAAQVAKSHSEGSKTEHWMMLNHITFPDRKGMLVETVVFDYGDDPEMYMSPRPPGAPTKLGEWASYRFDADAGVFVLE